MRRDHLCVAVAEDDHELRDVLAETLRERGLEVVEATDGATLLALIRRGGVSIAITDLLMPGLSGHDVIALCRSTGLRLPFIVVTGAPEVFARAIGASSDVILLRKPFPSEDLIDAVATAIARCATC